MPVCARTLLPAKGHAAHQASGQGPAREHSPKPGLPNSPEDPPSMPTESRLQCGKSSCEKQSSGAGAIWGSCLAACGLGHHWPLYHEWSVPNHLLPNCAHAGTLVCLCPE